MKVGTARITLYAPWVHSLKEKRMVVRSVVDSVQHKFRVSIAEVEEQNLHQTIVIGFAAVAGSHAQASSILDHVIEFIEDISQADVTDIQREVR
jgi:uncharacterized protein YlxP (DUF503 family)